MRGQDNAGTRQNAPHRLWHLVALEQQKATAHTGPTFNAGRPSRRCSVTKLLFVVLTVGLLASQGTAAPSKRQSIQGVWQAVEVTITGPGARTITIPQPRPNLTILTARHYSQIHDDAERPRPVPADVTKASADELRALWGPFAGDAGTYQVTGNVITMRPVVAKNPAAMAPGAFISYSYTLDGDTLRVTEQRTQ